MQCLSLNQSGCIDAKVLGFRWRLVHCLLVPAATLKIISEKQTGKVVLIAAELTSTELFVRKELD